MRILGLSACSNNAKAHPIEQIDKIAASTAAFGFDQPIVVDADGVIIKGHGRREASLRIGLERVPVFVRHDQGRAGAQEFRCRGVAQLECHSVCNSWIPQFTSIAVCF